jgi:hypothetical protein
VTLDNDFVILKLEDPLHFGIDVQPAHLPNSEQVNKTRCFVSGWGSLEPGTYTLYTYDLLKYVSLLKLKPVYKLTKKNYHFINGLACL